MFSYLPSYHLQLVLNDFKCFSLLNSSHQYYCKTCTRVYILTRTKVVRLSEHAQKNVFFSLYDVRFLFVPSSETS